jgi:hypothetical protein
MLVNIGGKCCIYKDLEAVPSTLWPDFGGNRLYVAPPLLRLI